MTIVMTRVRGNAMNHHDKKQDEAIRRLAKLSASHLDEENRTFIEIRDEEEEKDRISRSVKHGYTSPRPEPVGKDVTFIESLFNTIKILVVLAVLGFGLYGILMAYLAS
ncbi:hypothetical protein FCV66_19580 [Enterovibrio norvegicus]|uniref:hypothetical protein n=1 Tax=Enterovibrio norvegicus TaxID=188144 RepID=UPI00105565BA|nr:hypothetical protein [Enterovibrio norvegicus]TKF10562.1 hypothetical protein FCV66_19580 [Enterovibrio norvegicus]